MVYWRTAAAAAAAKSLQSCPTLCDPIDGSPPGSPVPGILQARTLEWVAISFSNAWKWKWSHPVVPDSSRPHGLQPTRFLCPWDFPGKSTGMDCHCLLHYPSYLIFIYLWYIFYKREIITLSTSMNSSVDEVIYKISFEIMCAVCSQSFSQVWHSTTM